MMTSMASFALEGRERGLCFGDFGLRVLSPSVVVEHLLLAEMFAADVALVNIILFYVVLVEGIVHNVIVMSLTDMLVEIFLPYECRTADRATVLGVLGYRYLALVHI